MIVKQLFLGLSAILLASGNAAKAFADNGEFGGAEEQQQPDGAPGDEQPAKRRGRPPGSGAAKPAEAPAKEVTETPEDALAKRKLIIKPYLDDDKGEEVKKIIAKFSKTGLKDVSDADLAAFEKDLKTLEY